MQGLAFLRLQQISDSAIPIGGAAHSFGLESLVDAGLLGVESLDQFFTDYLGEAGVVEAAYCERSAAACELSELSQWLEWNAELGARKTARESREGSAAMGRRFLQLAARVSACELLRAAAARAAESGSELHLAPCFGLAAGAFGVEAGFAAPAYLQQSVITLISACQRLLPLGQTRAQEILWSLKPAIAAAADRGRSLPLESARSFTPLLDVASARHPTLRTRLFIS